MGSVLSEEKCKCGGVVTIDDYYKTFEIYVSCNRCGYFYSRELKRDENYNLFLMTKESQFTLKKNCLAMVQRVSGARKASAVYII